MSNFLYFSTVYRNSIDKWMTPSWICEDFWIPGISKSMLFFVFLFKLNTVILVENKQTISLFNYNLRLVRYLVHNLTL